MDVAQLYAALATAAKNTNDCIKRGQIANDDLFSKVVAAVYNEEKDRYKEQAFPLYKDLGKLPEIYNMAGQVGSADFNVFTTQILYMSGLLKPARDFYYNGQKVLS